MDGDHVPCLGNHPATCVQEGTRPVLVISNDISNKHANTLTVLPMTSKMKKPWSPVHIYFGQEEMVKDTDYNDFFYPSTVLVEQFTTQDKKAFRSRVGRVDDEEKKKEINEALKAQLGTEAGDG